MTDQALPAWGPLAQYRAAIVEASPPQVVDADDRYMFPRRVRHAMIAYVLLAVPVCTLLSWESSMAPFEYMRTMAVVGGVFVVPGLVLAVLAAVRAHPADRLTRGVWAVVFAAGTLAMVSSFRRLQPGMDPAVMRTSVPVLVTLVLLVVANTLMMRARSGQRAALVDAVDLVMATLAITVPLGLAFGRHIVDSPVPWFTTAAALWVVVACHGTLVSFTIRNRLHPDHRTLANIGIAFGLTVSISSLLHVVLGLNEFQLPIGPFVALYAIATGVGVLFFAYATQRPSLGLERLPPGAQVRRNCLIAVLILVAVPVTGLIVWWRHDDPGVPEAAIAAGLVLLTLSSLRHLLAARETTRLYAMVERSAQERGELLSEVMSHVDTDRHRAAAHLHRQAATLYAAMASFSTAIDQAVEAGNPASVSFAAERLRRDLGQRADGLRRLAEAVRPLAPSEEDARRLTAPMRAYLENLCGDGPRPDLNIDVDPELALDWSTEAAVLRIIQEATLDAWWHAHASRVDVSVRAGDMAVEVEILDDGTGDAPPNTVVGTMQSVTRFLGGDLSTSTGPDGERRVYAQIPFAMAVPEEPRTHLRVVGPR